MATPQPIKPLNEHLGSNLDSLLNAQKKAFLNDPMPTRETRVRRLDKLHNALLDNQDKLIAAVNEDFGNRAAEETELLEIVPLFEGIAYYRKRLKRLMKAERRHVPPMLAPAKVSVIYQPVGVVGIVVPWNFPIFLALSPLIGAIAAGNRAMLKLSEFTPKTGALLQEILTDNFADDEVVAVNGDVDVATRFTQLPFDHLVYTGSTHVGRIVMRAAAENLTPVTLELGGKSPAIVHKSFPVKEAASRIALGKGINAGQVCVSPDYVFCPRDQVDDFCDAFADATKKSYPSFNDNPDYTSIITERQRERLERYLSDAEEKGAELITVYSEERSPDGTNKLPMTIVKNATNDMLLMQEEIFGPILPILPYDDIDEPVNYVNRKARPLALYYFDWDNDRATKVLESTHSGGACINDTMSQVIADDIPFGGIGPSGMGHYHGREGFRTFSHAKGVVKKGKINSTSFVAPPWGNFAYRQLMKLTALRFRRRKID